MEPGELRGQVWNWLPTFLAVAEAGSVSGAAKALGVTAAAVSRTVKLLEDRLGTPLFHRVGRSLTLSAAGERLRDAMRGAVQRVDLGLRQVSPRGGPRAFRVASLGVLTEHFVVPALVDVAGAHPDVRPEHLNMRPTDALDALRRYEVDLAFYYEELGAEGIDVAALGTLSKSVYCGRGHPLFDPGDPGTTVSRDDVLAETFSVPQVGDSGAPMDGWPSDFPRRVGMRVTLLRSNLQVALSGRHLCVLPDVTAAPHRARGDLRRLPAPELGPIPVFAARRTPTAEVGGDRPELDAAVVHVAAAIARIGADARFPSDHAGRSGPGDEGDVP